MYPFWICVFLSPPPLPPMGLWIAWVLEGGLSLRMRHIRHYGSIVHDWFCRFGGIMSHFGMYKCCSGRLGGQWPVWFGLRPLASLQLTNPKIVFDVLIFTLGDSSVWIRVISRSLLSLVCSFSCQIVKRIHSCSFVHTKILIVIISVIKTQEL